MGIRGASQANDSGLHASDKAADAGARRALFGWKQDAREILESLKDKGIDQRGPTTMLPSAMPIDPDMVGPVNNTGEWDTFIRSQACTDQESAELLYMYYRCLGVACRVLLRGQVSFRMRNGKQSMPVIWNGARSFDLADLRQDLFVAVMEDGLPMIRGEHPASGIRRYHARRNKAYRLACEAATKLGGKHPIRANFDANFPPMKPPVKKTPGMNYWKMVTANILRKGHGWTRLDKDSEFGDGIGAYMKYDTVQSAEESIILREVRVYVEEYLEGTDKIIGERILDGFNDEETADYIRNTGILVSAPWVHKIRNTMRLIGEGGSWAVIAKVNGPSDEADEASRIVERAWEGYSRTTGTYAREERMKQYGEERAIRSGGPVLVKKVGDAFEGRTRVKVVNALAF